MLFGVLSGVQYLLPAFIKESIPFSNLRPMHVTAVISWIILTATGGIYFYIRNERPVSALLSGLHLAIFLVTGVLIFFSYATNRFGGKEYLEFPPYLIVPIVAGWLLFGIHYFRAMAAGFRTWPVYNYMWATGIIMMVYHLGEACLWLNPEIGGNFIKSLTVQWKAGGSFVGAWNMLVYGTAIFLMSKIGPSSASGHSRIAFFFYFLGLTNLMFGWAHHVYIVPTVSWVRMLSYAISMTEWIILFHMIYQWRKSVRHEFDPKYAMTLKFLTATDFWIFLNLILALLFSIPAINYFTHGTHITVAHSMGTTIGINTTILLASVFYIAAQIRPGFSLRNFRLGFKIFNVSLFFFFLSLIAAGVQKSIWQYGTQSGTFSQMQDSLRWTYMSFVLWGIGIMIGISMLAIPLLYAFLKFASAPAKPNVWPLRPVPAAVIKRIPVNTEQQD